MEAKYQRVVNPTKQYDALIPKANFTQDIVNKNGNVKHTIGLMKEIILTTHWQAKNIAEMLAKKSGYAQNKDLNKLCETVWNFVYNHYQYAKDQDGLEQLRSFQRAWQDRFTGVDCDCMSITIGSILTCLKVPFFLRVTKYTGDWQHVYVAVYDNKKSTSIIMDCVLDEYNKEEPFTDKIDTLINPLTMLNGLGMPIAFLNGLDDELSGDPAQDELMAILSGSHFDEIEALQGLSGLGTDLAELSGEAKLRWNNSVKNHLVATRDYISKYPSSVMDLPGGADAQMKLLNHALKHWGTKNQALAIADCEAEEARINGLIDHEISGLHGLGDTDIDGLDDTEIDGLGKKKKKGGAKFFKKIKEAGKKAFKGLQKVNPIMVAGRNGFLLAAKLNFFNIAKKLYPAYMTEQQAVAAGLTKAVWERKVKAGKQFADKWENLLGGKASKLKMALEKGWKKKHKGGFKPKIAPATKTTVAGLGEVYELNGQVIFYGDGLAGMLGEVMTAAVIGTSVAAAGPIILQLAKILKKNNAGDVDEAEGGDPELDGFEEYNGVTGYETEAELGELGKRGKKKKEKKKKGKKGGVFSKILDVAEGVLPAAGGMASAVKQLHKAKTGGDLQEKTIDEYAKNPESGLSEEAQKNFAENDAKMKASQSGGFFSKMMNWLGENKVIAGVGAAAVTGTVLVATGVIGGKGKKESNNYQRSAAPTTPVALNGANKSKSKASEKAKVLTLG